MSYCSCIVLIKNFDKNFAIYQFIGIMVIIVLFYVLATLRLMAFSTTLVLSVQILYGQLYLTEL